MVPATAPITAFSGTPTRIRFANHVAMDPGIAFGAPGRWLQVLHLWGGFWHHPSVKGFVTVDIAAM